MQSKAQVVTMSLILRALVLDTPPEKGPTTNSIFRAANYRTHQHRSRQQSAAHRPRRPATPHDLLLFCPEILAWD